MWIKKESNACRNIKHLDFFYSFTDIQSRQLENTFRRTDILRNLETLKIRAYIYGTKFSQRNASLGEYSNLRPLVAQIKSMQCVKLRQFELCISWLGKTSYTNDNDKNWDEIASILNPIYFPVLEVKNATFSVCRFTFVLLLLFLKHEKNTYTNNPCLMLKMMKKLSLSCVAREQSDKIIYSIF